MLCIASSGNDRLTTITDLPQALLGGDRPGHDTHTMTFHTRNALSGLI